MHRVEPLTGLTTKILDVATKFPSVSVDPLDLSVHSPETLCHAVVYFFKLPIDAHETFGHLFLDPLEAFNHLVVQSVDLPVDAAETFGQAIVEVVEPLFSAGRFHRL